MRIRHRAQLLALAASAGLLSISSLSSSAQWQISTYDNAPLQIVNYPTADALIGGKQLQAGFPITNAYSFTNVQDNGDGSGVAGLATGQQIIGLPAGDNNDFVFVGKGTVTVNTAGTYVFTNNTDDGSRLKGSVNGGPLTQIITDEVLSGGHDVSSAGIPLPAGAQISFEWMWYERGGGAHGNVTYTRDGGPRVAVGDNSQGLSLDGGSYQGSVYKSTVTGTVVDSLATANSLIAPGNLKGTTTAATFNIMNSGGDGHFAGGVQPPGYDGSDHDNYVVNGTGFLHVANAGDYKFASLSDDGAQMILKDPTGATTIASIIDDSFHGAGDPGDIKYSSVIHLNPGDYPISYLYMEAGGGSSGELFLVDPNSNAPIALVGDTANGGLEVRQSVPEPGTIGLLGLAGVAVLARRRRA